MSFLSHASWFSLLSLVIAGLTAVGCVLTNSVRLRRTRLDGLVALFAVSLLLAVWVAFNPALAWAKLLILTAAILFYYLAVGVKRPRFYGVFAVLLGSSTLLLALYFLLTHNWQTWPADLALLTRVGVWWMGIRPFLEWQPLHPNLVGGWLALLLPFVGAASWELARQRRWVAFAGMVAVTAVLAGALLLSSSRGAWLALFLALLISGAATFLQRRGVRQAYVTGFTAVMLLLAVALMAGMASVMTAGGMSRATLARQTFDLVAEVPFTGSGLLTFGGLYSQHIRVIPFFYFSYGHNLYLDIWLEQGLLGILSFLGMIGSAFWLLLQRRSDPQRQTVQGVVLASLLTMVLHGVVDDALYGSFGTPFLLVLVGASLAVTEEEGTQTAVWPALSPRFTLALLGLFVGLLLLFHRPLLAQWHASLGVLSLDRVELAEWPLNRWDNSLLAQETQAASHFETALSWNEQNATAHYHLGRMALARHEFAQAAQHLEAALATWPAHHGIIKSLGYSYVWMGDYDHAQPLLALTPEASEELGAYSWWWRQHGQEDLALYAETMLSQLK